MSVTLDPPELGFRRPFTHEVTQLLRLSNPSKDPIAFKASSSFMSKLRLLSSIVFGPIQDVLKSAARLRCKVGNINVKDHDPSGSENKAVLLQAMKEDPPLDARCRDKFLVQSVAITPERDLGNVTAIWQNAEKISKGSIEERKIRVVFLPADGTTSTPQHKNVNGTHLGNDAPPAYGSPAPSYGSPAPEAVTPSTRSANAADSRPFNDSKGMTESASNGVASAQSTVGAAASSLANAVPTSGDDLQAQLSQAKATIARMTQQSDEQGLRQRKADAVNQDSRERITTGTTGMGIQQQPADGVPVQIVAALCLLSFLLAYFLF